MTARGRCGAAVELGVSYTSRRAALKAHVKNGRLVLDAPTDLPDGTEVTLAITDDETR